jgi:hypothetical protein
MDAADLLDQLHFAHDYTNRLLETTPTELWLRVPPAGVSHVAWQVGHLAMAGYRLGLERIRGRQPGDDDLIGGPFLALFGRDSAPAADPTVYPAAEVIRRVFDRVHERVFAELPSWDDDELGLPPHKPHSLCPTRRDCLVWCAHHQMLHAGQIGLLRRQLGLPPLW